LSFLACHNEIWIVRFSIGNGFSMKKLGPCLTNCGLGLLTLWCLWPCVNRSLNGLTFSFPRGRPRQSVKQTTTWLFLRRPTTMLILPTLLSYSPCILRLLPRKVYCMLQFLIVVGVYVVDHIPLGSYFLSYQWLPLSCPSVLSGSVKVTTKIVSHVRGDTTIMLHIGSTCGQMLLEPCCSTTSLCTFAVVACEPRTHVLSMLPNLIGNLVVRYLQQSIGQIS
jgi:hypothetical protein